MKLPDIRLKHPFGEVSFEQELRILREHYKEYFFGHLPFNERSLDPSTYLIVGRRGAGKSSLAYFFTFQDFLRNATCIDIDEPKVYQDVLPEVASLAADTTAIAIPQIVKMWEVIIWSLIFNEYKDRDPIIREACLFQQRQGSISSFVRKLIKHFVSLLAKNKDGKLVDEAEKLLASEVMQRARKVALAQLQANPVIVAIDTLEHHDVENEPMMRATAALIECASNFNTEYSERGIHIKLFIMAEVFPHLTEAYTSNVLKFVRDEVYLHWRPRDLIRLLCWRFYKFLGERGMLPQVQQDSISWEKFPNVYDRVWKPTFGEYVTNRRGVKERSFPYLLRHTQNRPRQMVELCNAIARAANGTFGTRPLDPNIIVATVRETEMRLATEIINSYSQVYKNCGQIVDALMNFPMVFKGKLLDQYAPSTASNWPAGHYSPYRFRQLVAELGIVGRIRKKDDPAGVIAADFEYFLKGRLPLTSSDDCVIHPMFANRLNITNKGPYRVYPFPEHPDYNLIYEW